MIASVNGFEVSRLTVTRPRKGRSTLEALIIAEPGSIKKEAAVRCSIAGTAVFTGRASEADRAAGTVKVVARDAPGLEGMVPPRFYQDADEGLVARDVLREVGEQGDVTLPTPVPFYVRRRSKASEVLADLLRDSGELWRTRRDGRVFVGVEPREPFAPVFRWGESLYDYDPVSQTYRAALTPALEAGQLVTLEPYHERRTALVDRLEHVIQGREVFTRLWTIPG